jgi:hypothetical protein
MKAILEFNLPDDQQDFDLATKGMKFWSILWDLDQDLRAKTKYASDDLPQDKYDAYQEIREKLNDLMLENMISFDMVH